MASANQFVANAEYTSIFEVFSQGRTKQQQVWVGKRLVPKLVQRLGTTPKSSDFRVLAVGSGSGVFDLMLLEELFKGARDLLHGRKIQWTVVEPSDVAIKAFRDKVEKISSFENVEFEWIHKGFDQFENESHSIEPNFDFILFAHVLYYLDEDCALAFAYEKLLVKGGWLLIIVVSRDSIWLKLLDSFADKIELLHREFNCPSNITVYEKLSRKGWDVETFEGKGDLDISSVFVDGHPDCRALLQFFLHTKEDPKEVVGEELYSQLIEFFKSECWETVSNGAKKYFVNEDDGVLLAHK